MKKMYFLAFILLLGINVSAQNSPFQFGVKAGMNMSNASIENKEADPKFKIGYQIGLTVDYSLTQNWLIQSGLSFTTKGSKIDDFFAGKMLGGDGKGSTLSFNQQYFQLPVYGAYKVNVSDDFNVVIGAGPYIAYGIGGKEKYKLNNGTFGDGSNEKKYDTFGNGEDGGEELNRFDFGLGLNVSAEYGKIVVGLGYEHGITNIAESDYEKYRNRNASLTLGYKF